LRFFFGTPPQKKSIHIIKQKILCGKKKKKNYPYNQTKNSMVEPVTNETELNIYELDSGAQIWLQSSDTTLKQKVEVVTAIEYI
jgi:hypothetical protein